MDSTAGKAAQQQLWFCGVDCALCLPLLLGCCESSVTPAAPRNFPVRSAFGWRSSMRFVAIAVALHCTAVIVPCAEHMVHCAALVCPVVPQSLACGCMLLRGSLRPTATPMLPGRCCSRGSGCASTARRCGWTCLTWCVGVRGVKGIMTGWVSACGEQL